MFRVMVRSIEMRQYCWSTSHTFKTEVAAISQWIDYLSNGIHSTIVPEHKYNEFCATHWVV